MTYKDQTFCEYYKECNDGDNCSRALTPEEHAKAIKWWGNEDAPIMVFVEKPDCFKIKENKYETKKYCKKSRN